MMKRWLSLLLAAVMCLGMVPVAKAEGANVVLETRNRDTLRYWVTLRGADEGQDDPAKKEFEQSYENVGTAEPNCLMPDAWWAERYSDDVPLAKIVFQAPANAYSYKAEIVDALPTTSPFDANKQPEPIPDADTMEFPEVHLDYPFGTIQDNVLTLNNSTFYVLITWFDKDNVPLDNGKIEYIAVTPRYPNVESTGFAIQLPQKPYVPVSEQASEWMLCNVDETVYGNKICFEKEAGAVGYGFDLTAMDWQNCYNQYNHRVPAAEGVIIAPADAVAYTIIDSVEQFNMQELLEDANCWIDVEPFVETLRATRPLSFDICEINETADGTLLSTIDCEATLLIVWKKSDTELVDLGNEQYINSFTMKITHETDYTNEPIEVIETEDMVPYHRDEPTVWNVWFESFDLPESLRIGYNAEEAGKITLQTAFDQEEYQSIYNSRLAGSESIWMNVDLPAPAGAVMVSKYISDDFDENAHEVVMRDSAYYYFENELYMRGCSIEYASVRRYDATILIDPYDNERWLYASWKDENGKLINIGTEEKPSYVEYIKLEMRHDSLEDVAVTDASVIADEDIFANATQWDEAAFGGKEIEIANSEVIYYIDYSKLDELNDAEPETYAELVTQVKAPEEAAFYVVTGRNLNTEDGGEIPESGCVDAAVPMPDEVDKVNYFVEEFVIDWYDADWVKLGNSRLTVTMLFTAAEPWMEDLQGDWQPAESERLGSTADNTDVRLISEADGIVKNEYLVECPQNDSLTLTVTAPEDAKIVKYRVTSKATPYVMLHYPENEDLFAQIPQQLEAAEIRELGEDRTVTFEDMASFKAIDVAVDRKNKNFTNTIYLHETYGNNIEDTTVRFVQWLDEEENVICSEYVYHQVERLDKLAETGVYKILSDHPEYHLVVRLYRQHAHGNKQNQGAYYVQMWVEDEKGKKVQPTTKLSIRIPYPEGSDADCDFVIEHFEDESHMTFEIVDCEKKNDGIYLTLDHFSPFMISWEKTEKDQEGEPPVQEPEGDGSGSSGYYPDYGEHETEPENMTADYRVVCRKLNVRSGAGTQYEKLGTLARGAIVHGKELENGWIEIEYNGMTGYICAQYAEAVGDAECIGTVHVLCRRLNVRTGAGTRYDRVGRVSRGEALCVVSERNGWYEILYGNGTAWVCAKYAA